MSDTVIRVENLGKKYIIGHQQQERYTALRDVIANGAKSLGRKFIKPGKKVVDPTLEEFWALKDVSFEVKRGDRIGIIGRNGAGKSTLLKILSRITEPTEGRVSIKGRVASLLEVGTGFHPELTGRENIFLNGAILGMSKAEIKKKFDEIVAFAEVEKFLDTPVKRYSSGMYVRLAFAVAAHLEPEILIVDEVLAVGDSEFQNKCLGKIEDVTNNEGKTVLFVSHNMAAIKSLTSSCLVLNTGKLMNYSNTESAIESYQKIFKTIKSNNNSLLHQKSGFHTKFNGVKFLDKNKKEVSYYTPGNIFFVMVDFSTDGTSGMSIEIFLNAPDGAKLGLFSLYQFHQITLPTEKGRYSCMIEIKPLFLSSGIYTLDFATSILNQSWDSFLESGIFFEVQFCNPLNSPWDFKYSYGYGGIALISCDTPTFVEII